jgi:hypothetical protein
MDTKYLHLLSREIFRNIGGLHLCPFWTFRLGQVLAISSANIREKSYQIAIGSRRAVFGMLMMLLLLPGPV